MFAHKKEETTNLRLADPTMLGRTIVVVSVLHARLTVHQVHVVVVVVVAQIARTRAQPPRRRCCGNAHAPLRRPARTCRGRRGRHHSLGGRGRRRRRCLSATAAIFTTATAAAAASRIKRVDVDWIVDGAVGRHGALSSQQLQAGQRPLAGKGVGVATAQVGRRITRVQAPKVLTGGLFGPQEEEVVEIVELYHVVGGVVVVGRRRPHVEAAAVEIFRH